MTKRLKLSKAILESLDPEKDGQWVTDTEVPQLVVRLTSTSKTYVARWTSPTLNKRRQEKIARFGEISISEARDRARKLVAKDRPKNAETLGDIFEIWEETFSSEISIEHKEEFIRTWNKHIKPDLGKTKLRNLKHATIQEWYRKKRNEYPVSPKGKVGNKTYSAATVKRWVSYISKLCFIARKFGHMNGNPVEGMEMATPNRRLDVFVRPDVISLSQNIDAIENRFPIGAALIRFLMIYPCRGKEAREMLWDDIDLNERTWTIPASRYKTDRDKVFPLGPLQIAHLQSLPRWSPKFVFPRPSATGVGSSRKSQKTLDLPVTKNHQIYVWNIVRPKTLGIHTLRKTIGHMMLNNGAPLEIVSKLMGHSNTLVTQQIYAQLDPQKAAKYLSMVTQFIEDEKQPETDELGTKWMLEMQAAISSQAYNAGLEDPV